VLERLVPKSELGEDPSDVLFDRGQRDFERLGDPRFDLPSAISART